MTTAAANPGGWAAPGVMAVAGTGNGKPAGKLTRSAPKMAVYSFLEEFVPLIRNGAKKQTVRNMRKFPPRVGTELVLKCKGARIGTAVITEVFPLKFHASRTPLVMVNGKVLSKRAESAFAKRDGLDAAAFKKFLRTYSRKKNVWNEFLVIRWKDFREACPAPN